jgi:putative FmdB family regulatory protein
MPTYDYRCAKCGEDLEVYQSFSDAPLTKHKGCGGKLTKVLSPAGIVLKGSGFYKTDNRGNGKSSATKKETASESKSESKTDSSSDSSKSSSKDSSSSTSTTKSEAKSA